MKDQTVTIGKDIIRGHIDTIVLTLLSEQDRYGFEVYKEVLARSGGEYELKEPSLYSAFRRLEGEGHISALLGRRKSGRAAEILHDNGNGSGVLRAGKD